MARPTAERPAIANCSRPAAQRSRACMSRPEQDVDCSTARRRRSRRAIPGTGGRRHSDGRMIHSATYSSTWGPGSRHEATNNTRTSVGERSNLRARPAQTPAITRRRGRTSALECPIAPAYPRLHARSEPLHPYAGPPAGCRTGPRRRRRRPGTPGASHSRTQPGTLQARESPIGTRGPGSAQNPRVGGNGDTSS